MGKQLLFPFLFLRKRRKRSMSGFKNLHPICSFSYFAIAIILVLVCQTPVAMVEALAGAVFFLQ